MWFQYRTIYNGKGNTYDWEPSYLYLQNKSGHIYLYIEYNISSYEMNYVVYVNLREMTSLKQYTYNIYIYTVPKNVL